MAASNGTIKPENVNREDLRNASVIGQVHCCEHNRMTVAFSLSCRCPMQLPCHISSSAVGGDKAGLAAQISCCNLNNGYSQASNWLVASAG